MRIENVKNVLLYCRPTSTAYEGVRRTFGRVVNELRSQGVERIYIQEALAKASNLRGMELLDKDNNLTPSEEVDLDVAISIGGDGAFVHAASLASRFDIPLLGINAGTLGFLTAYSKKEVKVAITALMSGLLIAETRDRIYCEHYRGGRLIGQHEVFNDIVLKHGSNQRLLDLAVSIGGKGAMRFKADGIVVCTASGSTAYNLACGGPIVLPQSGAFAVTPICSHGLTTRPVIFSGDEGIEVEYVGPDDSDAAISADGLGGNHFLIGDRVHISKSKKVSKVVPASENVFETLADKIGWSRI